MPTVITENTHNAIWAQGVTISNYSVTSNEEWIWHGDDALASVKRGLQQAQAGQTTYLGSFASHSCT
jgi:hypothetical protein